MNLKYFVVMSAALVGVVAHASRRGNDVLKALAYGAEFDVTIRVVDDEDHPVAGVKCSGWMAIERAPNHGGGYERYTDKNGFARIVGRCGEWFSVIARKDGYYTTTIEVKYPARETDIPIVDGKWQPYGETRTVVLKKIKNPWKVKVLAGEQCNRRIPKFGEWVGFDFECGDWISPYGKGEVNDILVRFSSVVRKRNVDFTFVMEISFTNNVYAGFYQKQKDLFSDLKSDHVADSNAMFKTGLIFVQECIPGKPRRWDFLSDDSYLVFRTRTRVDENGNLIGSHYGKIYGYWCSDDAVMTFGGGCFNPIENDPNIEGDQTLLYAIKNYKRGK